ncbi:MAG: AbrB family transcriptional regulator [Thermoprotei archaeon]|nr:MAG: AbrB family transcriptional regulator [Thermoprotei archaeon]
MITEIRVGKRRTIVIPKAIAEALNIEEGSKLRLEVKGDSIILKVIPDAIWLSVHGEKFAKITLKELEGESIEKQKEYIENTY